MFYPGYLRALFLLRNCVFNPFIAPWVLLSSKMFYPGYFSLENGLLLQQLLLMLLLIILYFWTYFQIENILLWVYCLRNLLQSTGQSGTFFDFTSKSEKNYRWSCFFNQKCSSWGISLAEVFTFCFGSPNFCRFSQVYAKIWDMTSSIYVIYPQKCFTWVISHWKKRLFQLSDVLPGVFIFGTCPHDIDAAIGSFLWFHDQFLRNPSWTTLFPPKSFTRGVFFRKRLCLFRRALFFFSVFFSHDFDHVIFSFRLKMFYSEYFIWRISLIFSISPRGITLWKDLINWFWVKTFDYLLLSKMLYSSFMFLESVHILLLWRNLTLYLILYENFLENPPSTKFFFCFF